MSDWRASASCVQVPAEVLDAFWPSSGPMGELAATAVRVCLACPVREACLADELEYPIGEQHGIRGGLTAEQRVRMLQARKRAGVYAPSRSGLVQAHALLAAHRRSDRRVAGQAVA